MALQQFYKFFLTFPALFCMALLAVPVLAQQDGTSDGDSFDLGTIVLEGQLLETTLEESQTSVAVFTGEALETTGETLLFELYNRTANVTAINGNNGISIRGISESGVAGFTQSGTISIQYNGVALPGRARWLNPVSTWDLGQVEILRGPQSTQQGANALAGAVVSRSNDPIFGSEYAIRGDIGNFDAYRFAFMGNTELVEDRLALRFTADLHGNDGYLFNPTRNIDDADAREFESYRAALRWAATDDIDLVLSYSHAENRTGSDFVNLATFPAQRLNLSNVPNEFGARTRIWGLRGTWNINEVFTLESETSYYTVKYDRLTDADGSPAMNGFTTEVGKYDGFEQDLRLRFDTDWSRGVVGVFFSDASELTQGRGFNPLTRNLPEPFLSQVVAIQNQFFGGNSIQIDGSNIRDATTRNMALFGEVDVPLDWMIPGLTATAGARYDYEEFDFRNQTITFTPQAPVLQQIVDGALPSPPGTPVLVSLLLNSLPNSVEAARTDYQAFLPKLGLRYDFGSDQTVGFTVQRGYRAGGSGISPLGGQFNFDPEYTNNYEISYRGSFLDNRLDLSANAFYTRWTDQQVNITLGFLDTRIVNAGESELYGAEASATFQATGRLSLYGSVGYVHTEFLNFVDNGNDLSGNRFPGAPEWTASLGGQYVLDNGLSLGVDMSFTDATFLNPNNLVTEKSDAFLLINANLNYTMDSGLTLGMYVRNLLDDDHLVSRFPATGTGVPGDPRTFGVFALHRF
ncbi:MAG: TonB-dependent receptor [Pseudomonadota bacterium]